MSLWNNPYDYRVRLYFLVQRNSIHDFLEEFFVISARVPFNEFFQTLFEQCLECFFDLNHVDLKYKMIAARKQQM